jgi:uncharacterized protein (TIGR03435 family)
MLAHLVDVSIRSLLLAIAAAVILWSMRNWRTAALQHAVWATVVCGMLTLWAFGRTLPRLPLRILDRPAAAVHITPAAGDQGQKMLDEAVPAELPPSSASVPAKPRRSVDWMSAMLYAYIAVALAFLAQFVTGVCLVRKLLAKAHCISSTGQPSLAFAAQKGLALYESDPIAVPFTVGWLRPKILLPAEWREWDDEKLEAVLAHEGAHARRRDTLVAGLAGLNRCIFWFHPLAWMLERKLALLAEQACDEACVAALGDQHQYARLLLEMALVVNGNRGRMRQHALTMAAASHIRQRIDSLLREGRTFSRGLTWTAWSAVTLCGIPLVWGAGVVDLDRQPPSKSLEIPLSTFPAALAQPRVITAQARPAAPPAAGPAPRVEFEVASVKLSVPGPITGGRSGGGFGCMESFKMDRGRVDLQCMPLKTLIAYAFRIPLERVLGPDWINDRSTARFDVDAKLPQGASEKQVPEMFQTLLAERFQLTVHRSTPEQSLLGLVIAKSGLKVKEAPPEADAPAETAPEPDATADRFTLSRGVLTRATRTANADDNGYIITMTNARMGTVRRTDGPDKTSRWEAPNTTFGGLADILGTIGPLPADVIDMTGLPGRYQVTLEISLQDAFAAAGAISAAGGDATAMENARLDMQNALLKALNDGLQKLGLHLERRKGPVETLVVDHVEKTPTGN